MASMIEKTPGVYINEISAFPNSVVEVPTAIPCFIGYTEQAIMNNKHVTGQAVRLTKFSEYSTVFGGAPARNLGFAPITSGKPDFALSVLPTSFLKFTPVSNKPDKVASALLSSITINPTKIDPTSKGFGTKIIPIPKKTTFYSFDGAIYSYTPAVTGNKATPAKSEKLILVPPSIPASSSFAETTTVPPLPADFTGTNSKLKGKIAVSKTTGQFFEFDTEGNSVVEIKGNTVGYDINQPGLNGQAGNRFYLYDSLKMFYQNGGGTCYVISIGNYPKTLNPKDMVKAIDTLKKHAEPTMLVIPDALSLPPDQCYSMVYKYMLEHCGEMMNRVAVLDVWRGYQDLKLKTETSLQDAVKSGKYDSVDVVYLFRDGIGTGAAGKKYGAAYYPWVNTSLYTPSTIDFTVFDASKSLVNIQKLLLAEAKNKNANKKISDLQLTKVNAQINAIIPPSAGKPPLTAKQIKSIHEYLMIFSPNNYKTIITEAAHYMNILPVAGAMAGVYTRIDDEIGVWEAPANTGMASVVGPTVTISDDMQQNLNVPIDGLAVNAIRSFTGRGTLIWGARTLDGNSEDNRYINVRRTLIMIEQSIKDAAEAYVFDPNDEHTWNSVKAMIENFLNTLWKEGALVGPSAATAYKVSVGAATMTSTDILDGYMRITVMVALAHPAEFIMLTFEQMQQTL